MDRLINLFIKALDILEATQNITMPITRNNTCILTNIIENDNKRRK